MKPIISDCQTFLEYDTMKFMACRDQSDTCDDCYFYTPSLVSECMLYDSTRLVEVFNWCGKQRNDGQYITWMRTE